MTVVVTTSTGDGTCCCGGTPCICGGCYLCKQIHRRAQRYPCAWIFEGSGFVNGNASCSVLNGSFRMLPNVPPGSIECSWGYTDAQKTIVWIFDNLVYDRWELRITLAGQPTIIYGIVGPDWRCCGTNFPIILEDPPVGFCGEYGSIVLRPEQINDECPCPPNTCVCVPCFHCDNLGQQYPCQWTLVSQGFADGIQECSRFNRTFILSMDVFNQALSCFWQYDDPTDVVVQLGLSFANYLLELYIPTHPGLVRVARYSLPRDQWNCCGTNTLNLEINDNVCQIPNGVPTTLTVQPVTPCACEPRFPPQPCCQCTAGVNLVRSWNITVAGVNNGTCLSCGDYNGTFTLNFLPVTSGCDYHDFRVNPTGCQRGTSTLPNYCFLLYTWRYDGLAVTALGPTGDLVGYNLPIPWNCTGPNILTLASSTGECTNWPATITMTPSQELVPVCQCWPPYDAISLNWTAQLTGFVGDPNCCQFINGNHILIKQTDVDCHVNFGGYTTYCVWSKKLLIQGGSCDGLTVCITLTLEGSRIFLAIVFTSPAPPFNDYIEYYFLPTAQFNSVGLNVFQKADQAHLCNIPPLGQRRCTTTPATINLIPA